MIASAPNHADFLSGLTVADAMTANITRVWMDQHPASLSEGRSSAAYAVFRAEDGTFQGVVTAGRICRYPRRIFADLLPGDVPAGVPADTPLQGVLDRFQEQDAVVPVLDESGDLAGVVTAHSLLQRLLQAMSRPRTDATGNQVQLIQSLLALMDGHPGEETLARRSLEILARRLHADAGALAVYDRDGRPAAVYPWNLTAPQAQQLATMSECRPPEPGASLCIPDLAQEESLADLAFYHPDCRSLLVQGLVENESPCGRLFLLRHDGNPPFGVEEEHLVQLAGRLLGLALHCILERRRYERLEHQLRLSSLVFEYSQAAIIITDARERILAVNPAFTLITGYRPEEVVGKTPRVLSSGEQDAAFYRRMWRSILEHGEWQGEIRNRRKNGELYTEWLKINAVRDAGGQVTHYIATFFDITERVHSDRRIEELVHYDVLTGLPNRLLARERIKQAMLAARDSGRKVALLFMDLDHFKHVNDSLGHPAGDRLLQVVSQRLHACIRRHLRDSSRDMIARLGGDEFLLLLNDLEGREEAAAVACRILEAFREPVVVAGQGHCLSLSIGIALVPDDAATIDELISRADLAMYEAKRRGRNTFCFFDSGMSLRCDEILMLKNSLHQALERGEFYLEYQPRVTMADRIVACEALMRWRHPEQGLVPPAKFIPLLEESGRIEEVGNWLLQAVCRQCRAWQEAGADPRLAVAVNLSARQFRDPRLVSEIEQALAASGLAPHCLEIELTESVAVQDVQATITTLEGLAARGIRCSLDDFGTGYSSLSYLRDFRLAALKIDKSFVARVPHREKDNAVVQAVISTAHALGLKVVAEGVEYMEQKSFLEKHGCEEYQGYLFSRPLPADEVERLITRKRS